MPGSGYSNIKDKSKEEAWIMLLIFVLCMIVLFIYLVSCRYKRIIEHYLPRYQDRNDEEHNIPPPQYGCNTRSTNNSIDNNTSPPPYNTNGDENENESRNIIVL